MRGTYLAQPEPGDTGNWQVVAYTRTGERYLVVPRLPKIEAKWTAHDRNRSGSPIPKKATLISRSPQLDLFAG